MWSFKEMVATCLVKDPKKLPNSRKAFEEFLKSLSPFWSKAPKVRVACNLRDLDGALAYGDLQALEIWTAYEEQNKPEKRR
ncbi:hypothetical protein MUK42_19127 [Musa troglodytarum]|uniref:Uncharacterized protein n=1 Tax=Musa troglodytarum TaxID=320322 RepID=A0A9E7F937_9LILI|nr:hypothetical protein MUK42_19127 [Musa troglodytarum]